MSVGPIGPIPLSLPHQVEAFEPTVPEVGRTDAVAELGQSFLEFVVQANASGHVAGKMMKQLASGQSDDIHGTMIAMSQSGIEKRLAVNIKDKVIDAFYEMWRMSL